MPAGPIPDTQSKLIRCHIINKINIENQLRQFCELEECTLDKKTTSIEEGICEELFVKTVKGNNEGRFIVTIPLKKETLSS